MYFENAGKYTDNFAEWESGMVYVVLFKQQYLAGLADIVPIFNHRAPVFLKLVIPFRGQIQALFQSYPLL